MYNRGKIITGLVIFLVIITAPFWANLVKKSYVIPELPVVTNATECIEDVEYMRTSHMVLLNEWRDSAIRDGKRTYINSKGKAFDISLQNTCMSCHVSKEAFCNKCHDAAGVTPSCWTCHIDPEAMK